jgi:hypothetical protein
MQKIIASLPVNYPAEVVSENSCRILQNRSQARQLTVSIPGKGLNPGKYSLEIAFCRRYGYERMPEIIQSRSFEILTERK